MRTTLRLDDRLLAQVKAIAQRLGKAKRARARLPVYKGKGLQPGVDLDDSAALLDLMDKP